MLKRDRVFVKHDKPKFSELRILCKNPNNGGVFNLSEVSLLRASHLLRKGNSILSRESRILVICPFSGQIQRVQQHPEWQKFANDLTLQEILFRNYSSASSCPRGSITRYLCIHLIFFKSESGKSDSKMAKCL